MRERSTAHASGSSWTASSTRCARGLSASWLLSLLPNGYGPESLNPRAQRVDEAVHDEPDAWAVDRSLMVHDLHHRRVRRREDDLPYHPLAEGFEVVERRRVGDLAPGLLGLGEDVLHRREPQAFLGAEARGQQGMAHAQAPAQLAHGRPVIAGLGERLQGAPKENIQIDFLAGARAAPSSWRGWNDDGLNSVTEIDSW